MRILYKFSSRSRPTKLLAVLQNIAQLARHDDYFIMLTLDNDDETCNTEQLREELKKYPKVIPFWGTSTGKVNAINRDIEFAGEFDILVNMSDDQLFLWEGFDLRIINDAKENFSDTDFFLHYPDGTVNERLCTLSIIGRDYFNRFNFIYHPDYISLYCDQEAMAVAQILGKYKYIPIHLFKHFHPAWGLAEMDEQYKKTESFYGQDGLTFQRRQAKHFDLPI